MIKEIEIIAGEGMRNFGFYSAFMSLEQGGEHRYGAIPAVSSEWTAYRQAQGTEEYVQLGSPRELREDCIANVSPLKYNVAPVCLIYRFSVYVLCSARE